MSDWYQDLKNEFQDAEYRHGYAESFLNTKLAAQIKTLREQRGKTQAEIAALMGIKQPGYRRFEDVNHSVWKTDTLWSIARAFGVRLSVSFETFGSLLDEKRHFNKKSLERPPFEKDPAFSEQTQEPHKIATAGLLVGALQDIVKVSGPTDSLNTSGGQWANWQESSSENFASRMIPSIPPLNEMMQSGASGGSRRQEQITTPTPDPRKAESRVENSSATGGLPLQHHCSPRDIPIDRNAPNLQLGRTVRSPTARRRNGRTNYASGR